MAYFVNTTQTAWAATSSITATLGAHITGDLLLVAITQDQGGTTIAPDATALSNGWAMLAQARASTLVRSAIAWKIASSGSEPNPTFTGATDDWLVTSFTVRDAHASPFGSLSSGTDYITGTFTTGASNASPSMTTAVSGCLLFYVCGVDGLGAPMQIRYPLSEARCLDKRSDVSSTNINQVAGYVQQESAGAIPTVNVYKSTSGRAGVFVVAAIRNKSGGALQPDIRPTLTEVYQYGNFGAVSDPAITWQSPSNFAASVGGINCSTTAPTITTGSSFDASANWGNYTAIRCGEDATLQEASAGAGIWSGGTHTISSTSMTGKIFGLTFYRLNTVTDNTAGSQGMIVVFSDGTNWVAYQPQSRLNGWLYQYPETCFIAVGSATAYASSGSINWGAVTRVGFFTHRTNGVLTNVDFGIKKFVLYETTAITGGGVNRPATFADYAKAMQSWDGRDWANVNGGVQTILKSPVQIGDGGSNTTYFDSSAESAVYPRSFGTTVVDQMKWNVNSGAITVKIKAGASDTIKLIAVGVVTQTNLAFTVDSSSSTSATYSTSGLSMVGYDVTWKAGVSLSACTFSGCGIVDVKTVDVSQLVFKEGLDNCYALAEDGASFTDCTFTAGTTAIYGIRVAAAGTITISGCSFSGLTKDFDVTATTGTVTIIKDAADPTPTYQTAGATVVISSPTVERGLEFTGLIAGSQVKVFETGTDSELFSDNSSSTTETWDDATGGSITVDYVIQKAGYLPIRVVGVTVTGAVGTGIQSVPVEQVVARWYHASSGLTINTNVFANASTKLWGLTTTSTLQNLASYLLEQWIALGDEGEAYANKAFPISANGPNSFTWLDGWEANTGTYAASITNLSRDGMRYVNSSGTATAIWAAILSVGVSSGMRVRYQQSDGGTTVNAAVTSGNMDELVQIYGDASHGNFDKRGYMVCKVQEMGYDQAEVDVVAQYGTLEDQLYVVGLSPAANGIATGNPGISGVTITDHGASPVTWNGKSFSITIGDAGTNTGTNIMRWIRYNLETGGTFQSKDGFNWHDLVQTNGTDFKGVRGYIYGDTGATIKGVRVIRGSDSHPDFNLHTADDGTTYAPPIVADISITSMPNAVGASRRLQIINQTAISASAWQASTAYSVGAIRKRTSGIGSEHTAGLYLRCTTAGTSAGSEPTWNTTVGATTTDGTAVWTTYAVLFYDDDPASTSYSTTYIDGEEFLAGESVEIRFAEMDADTSFKTYDSTATVSSVGFSFTVAEEADDVYATNAIDGSDYETTYSPNYIDDYIVLDTNTDFSGVSAYAYFCYLLTTSSGMYDFWGGVTALDVGNYRIESDVLDMYFDESAGFVKQTDTSRIFRKDGTRPALDPTTGGNGIEINWRTPVSVVTVAGASVITGDIADLPTASEVATAVLNAASTTPIHADAQKMNGAEIIGDGTTGNAWRGVGVDP